MRPKYKIIATCQQCGQDFIDNWAGAWKDGKLAKPCRCGGKWKHHNPPIEAETYCDRRKD